MRIRIAGTFNAATAASITLAALTLCTLPSAALAAGPNQIFVASRSGVISTSLGNNKITATSLAGVAAGYAYRYGFSTEILLEYGALFSKSGFMLHGFTTGVDYALWGGQNITLQSKSAALFDFEFPGRLGVFAGATTRSYNVQDFIPDNTITFDDTVPKTGSFMGVTGGVSLEIPLSENAVLLVRAAATLPWFASEPNQKGLVLEGGAGLGFLF
jgi:hypothetical protein